jgi:hypothetical protein
MDDPLGLAMLTSLCAVTEGALPERQPHPRVFAGLLGLNFLSNFRMDIDTQKGVLHLEKK